ncbi:MAG: TIGR01458 family HAD-type hydrolase [Verrucomicrobiota bacterium]
MNPEAKAVFFDLSGVLYEGSRVVSGAREAVATARDHGLAIRFLTNTATKAREDVLDKLGRFGIEAEPSELFTAPTAAVSYAIENRLRPFCLVHSAIEDDFRELQEEAEPNAVILGDAREKLHYDSLNRAFQLCMEGAPLIAIGKNRYFKTEDHLQLDAGAFVHGLEWATGCEAVVIGKPGVAFYEAAVSSTGFEAADCLMVGDDIEGDIWGAKDAGIPSLLVRTGKFREGDEARIPEETGIIDSVADLFS